VQLVLLQVLQQRAARAVHDALRHAGRARRVKDVQRMVEGLPRELRWRTCRAEIRKVHGIAQS
jgi:hypothetical protein